MQCETCINYVWDEELQQDICLAELDEDEYFGLVSGSFKSCPYYQNDDEYEVVRHQN